MHAPPYKELFSARPVASVYWVVTAYGELNVPLPAATSLRNCSR